MSIKVITDQHVSVVLDEESQYKTVIGVGTTQIHVELIRFSLRNGEELTGDTVVNLRGTRYLNDGTLGTRRTSDDEYFRLLPDWIKLAVRVHLAGVHS